MISPDAELTQTHLTAAARAAYPDEDLSEAGLAEQLAGAPALARQYATDLSARPVHRAACEVVIDWARVGFTRPIPHQVARDLTKARLPLRLQITTSDTDIDDALKDLCQPPAGPAGHTAALTPHPLDDDDQPGGTSEPRGFGYTPFPYLVAVDDGQDNTTPRPIPDSFWDAALHEAHTPADLTRLGYYASQHQQLHVAQTAWRHAADLGEGAAALGLGNLLADQDPPDLEGAAAAYREGITLGHGGSAFNLGVLLATRLDPPDLEGAAAAYREGIALGKGAAAVNLGNLLADQDPPDLEGAAAAYREGITLGEGAAAVNLGMLLATRLDPPDLEGAPAAYREGITLGDGRSAVNLGNLLATRLDPPDLEGAAAAYREGITLGDGGSAVNLGFLLAEKDLRCV